MNKKHWKPGTMIYPLPVVLVSCGDKNEGYNIITVAWTGIICTDPAMCYISVRPQRFSCDLISRKKEFVINLTTEKLAYAADWCGVRSGREYDKFKEMNLTPVPAQKLNAPLIKESPVNIECRVKQVIPLGTHNMFLSEIVAVNADNKYIDPKTEAFHLDQANLVCYSHGKYYSVGKYIGKFGYSVQKKTRKK